MPIDRVYLENFRLFKKKDLTLSGDKNFIQGLNGSGKTSVLESIEMLLNGKSFRTTKSKDCINHKSDSFNVSSRIFFILFLSLSFISKSLNDTVNPIF